MSDGEIKRRGFLSQVDITKQDEVAALFDGPARAVDVLVNSAGQVECSKFTCTRWLGLQRKPSQSQYCQGHRGSTALMAMTELTG